MIIIENCKIAEVIVDVPSINTDKPFSYSIPNDLQEIIKEGMRVTVPFGKRKVMGFVVGIRKEKEKGKLKDIDSLLDLDPIISNELIEMSEKISKYFFSFRISVLKSMLPTFFRTKYSKIINKEVSDEETEKLFGNESEINFENIENNNEKILLFNQLKKEDKVSVRYEVIDKVSRKTKNYFKINLNKEEINKEIEKLRKNSKQKKMLLDLLLEIDGKDYDSTFFKEKEITSQTLKTATTNKWLVKTEKQIYRNPLSFIEKNSFTGKSINLNDEQQNAVNIFSNSIDEKKSKVFLLEGVTGSGKTEVYFETIQKSLDNNKTALVLVPEISLTTQLVERFYKRFGDEISVLNSSLSDGEKFDEWERINNENSKIVIGTRSAIFAPLKNIGVIILDEEQDKSYKQEEYPQYHSRDVAIWRSNFNKSIVILGSATPSLESRARAQKKVYELVKIEQRANPNAELPEVKIIDMRDSVRNDNSDYRSYISEELVSKMREKIERKEQVVLMLNRRGYSTFALCENCGYKPTCPNCDVTLRYHTDSNNLKCHYCGYQEKLPLFCPNCGQQTIKLYGTGIQKVEEKLNEIFPSEKIIRIDQDSTRKKGELIKKISDFSNQKASILLGTQMISKGFDFPNTTLVGVLNADTSLSLPDFRASENTFQLLTQVAGRSGRGNKKGEVIVQTFNPDHYAIKLSKFHDYESFYLQEMNMRLLSNYSPFFFTFKILLKGKCPNQVGREINEIKNILNKNSLDNETIILGPNPSPIAKIKNKFYFQIIIKTKKSNLLEDKLEVLLEKRYELSKKGINLLIDREPNIFI